MFEGNQELGNKFISNLDKLVEGSKEEALDSYYSARRIVYDLYREGKIGKYERDRALGKLRYIYERRFGEKPANDKLKRVREQATRSRGSEAGRQRKTKGKEVLYKEDWWVALYKKGKGKYEITLFDGKIDVESVRVGGKKMFKVVTDFADGFDRFPEFFFKDIADYGGEANGLVYYTSSWNDNEYYYIRTLSKSEFRRLKKKLEEKGFNVINGKKKVVVYKIIKGMEGYAPVDEGLKAIGKVSKDGLRDLLLSLVKFNDAIQIVNRIE